MSEDNDSLGRYLYSRGCDVALTWYFALIVTFEALIKPFINGYRLLMNRVDTKKDMHSVDKAMKDLEMGDLE